MSEIKMISPRKFKFLMFMFTCSVCAGAFLIAAIVNAKYSNKSLAKQPACQSKFNQQTKSISIEHGREVLHKGFKPNRIVIVCGDKS